MTNFILNSRRVSLNPSDVIGEGGEAEVFKLDAGTVAKIFKAPNHRDFAHSQLLVDLAKKKQAERQQKLLDFPTNLPAAVIVPDQLLYSANPGQQLIIGYTMPYLQGSNGILAYTQRDFRERNDIDRSQIQDIFTQMHKTLSELHASGVVVGDFNSLNVLVSNGKSYFIDSDSMQFGTYLCSGYTSRYIDPLICDQSLKTPVLAKQFTEETDWYSFAVMLFECLLYVHPFGGVFKPSPGTARAGVEERPLRRISVFHPEVQYPRAAMPLTDLSKDLLTFFENTFVNDSRGQFPVELLDFAGSKNFVPMLALTPALKLCTTIGQLSCTAIFQTTGKILAVDWQDGRLVYVYWENGKFFREGGQQILAGSSATDISFTIWGPHTIAANRDSAYILQKGLPPEKLSVDFYRDEFPVLSTSDEGCFYVDGGKIWKLKNGRPQAVEDTLAHQTRLWIGQDFGFAFYQASQFRRAFVFNLQNAGKTLLPENLIPNNVISAKCYFSKNVVWFLTQRLEGNRFVNRCSAIDSKGNVLASSEAPMADDSWLGQLNGKTAAAKETSPGVFSESLLSTVNGAIVQIGIVNGQFIENKTFDFPQASTADSLVYSSQGLYLWNSHEIQLLSSTRAQNPGGQTASQAS